jgi:hypothetical protein
MAEDSAAGTRHARIMRGHGAVFGPTLDALVREADGRIPPEARAAHVAMLEAWPIAADGEVRDADALFARLAALAATPEARPAHVRPGSPAKAALGLVLGAAAGLPLGFLAWFIATETVLPYAVRGSDAVMWIITLGVAGAAGLVGARQGLQPSRWGQALAWALLAFVPGAAVSAVVAAFVAAALGEWFQVSQMEGAFAMGIVFTIMPIGGFLGGVACALWAGRRAWRRWNA